MTDEISIISDGTSLIVHTPYDPKFPDRAYYLGGRFEDLGRSWTFDARDERRVRELVREIYGTDGSDADAEKLVSVRLDLDEVPGYGEIRLAGRRIAWRPARDERVRLADGVVVIKGGFSPAGGSRNNPSPSYLPGTVLEVRDVPLSVARKMTDEAPGAEIVNAIAVERSALLAERDRLVARLAAIDVRLSEYDSDSCPPGVIF